VRYNFVFLMSAGRWISCISCLWKLFFNYYCV